VPDGQEKDPIDQNKEMARSLALAAAAFVVLIIIGCVIALIEEWSHHPTFGFWMVVRFFKNLFDM
jgi:hypothetical protein